MQVPGVARTNVMQLVRVVVSQDGVVVLMILPVAVQVQSVNSLLLAGDVESAGQDAGATSALPYAGSSQY